MYFDICGTPKKSNLETRWCTQSRAPQSLTYRLQCADPSSMANQDTGPLRQVAGVTTSRATGSWRHFLCPDPSQQITVCGTRNGRWLAMRRGSSASAFPATTIRPHPRDCYATTSAIDVKQVTLKMRRNPASRNLATFQRQQEKRRHAGAIFSS